MGCQGCHQLGTSGGRLGPSLNGVVGRRGEDFVHTKLADPRFDNRNSRMPDFGLSRSDIEAIVAYLATLDSA
jgi:mono/diheme cytochrome c family protein